MSKKVVPRIVVQLGPDAAIPMVSFETVAAGADGVGVDKDDKNMHDNKSTVSIADDKTLKLSLSSYQREEWLTFDRVALLSENLLKTELAALLDMLILKQHNCCMLRFNAQRECDLTFYNVFIAEMNKRLQQLKAVLHFVDVDYKDISSSTKSDKLLACGQHSAAKEVCGNTRKLLLWLHCSYRRKWSEHNGHDMLNFEFDVISETTQANFNVRFTLYNVYLCQMDTRSRAKWYEYMQILGDGGDTSNVRSALIAALRVTLEALPRWRCLMLFNIPTDVSCTADAIELLRMAYAIMRNRDRKTFNMHSNRNRKLQTHKTYSDNSSTASTSTEATADASICSESSNTNAPHTTDTDPFLPIQITWPEGSRSSLNSLSNWYHKIDEKFSNVFEAMEKYYGTRQQFEVARICEEIKSLASANDFSSSSSSSSNNCGDVDHHVFDNLKSAMEEFAQLALELQYLSLPKLQSIKDYLAAKNYELNQIELNHKIRQLECVSLVAKEQLNTLNLNLVADDID